ncbi:MAG: hypothetical protein U9O98_02380 [Asgard group archaeon]|nr:hypothetical protein [Asgard group archaeon]
MTIKTVYCPYCGEMIEEEPEPSKLQTKRKTRSISQKTLFITATTLILITLIIIPLSFYVILPHVYSGDVSVFSNYYFTNSENEGYVEIILHCSEGKALIREVVVYNPALEETYSRQNLFTIIEDNEYKTINILTQNDFQENNYEITIKCLGFMVTEP